VDTAREAAATAEAAKATAEAETETAKAARAATEAAIDVAAAKNSPKAGRLRTDQRAKDRLKRVRKETAEAEKAKAKVQDDVTDLVT
jgi:hypothetical protein